MKEIKDRLAEENPDAILFDALDEALISTGGQYTKPPVAVYSVRKIIEVIAEELQAAGLRQDHDPEDQQAVPATPVTFSENLSQKANRVTI